MEMKATQRCIAWTRKQTHDEAMWMGTIGDVNDGIRPRVGDNGRELMFVAVAAADASADTPS